MKPAAIAVALGIVSILGLSGCSSVTVKGVDTSGSRSPSSAPKRFYVVPFSTAGATIKEHPMRKHPGKLASEAQHLIATKLVEDLSKNIAPATLVPSASAAGRDGWLVTGQITQVNEGSRILRMAIGLGAGSTKLDTAVAVTNPTPSNPPFLKFKTTGTSGATPGAATNPIPFSSAPTALLQGQQGITDDAGRTARMITAAIADYMVSRGWMAAGTVVKPKTSP